MGYATEQRRNSNYFGIKKTKFNNLKNCKVYKEKWENYL